jgi:hypothetical protein
MPPKKKEEEVDLATLPPCKSVGVQLAYQGKKPRADKLFELIRTRPFKFERVVTRAEIIEHAKEKGFYTDPATLTDKQKKDPKVMSELVLELTPEVLARAAVSLLAAVEVKFRIELKARQDKLDNKDDDKKGTKKDAKKGAKEEPEKEEVPERDFDKNFDLLFYL